MDPRERFEALAALPQDEIPLAETALWIAAESRPQIDVMGRLDEIHALSERIRPAITGARSLRNRVELLNRAFFHEEGFKGNSEDYANPLNSFLDSVLDTRRGIPITLAILYLEVAHRLNLPGAGVGFPGHFLIKVCDDHEEIIVDPFFGRILSHQNCRELLQTVAGNDEGFAPELLDATPTPEILQRVLRNLKLLHLAQKNFEPALACSDRILLLAGDDLSELRDRALIYHQLECAGPALQDLERYLVFAPKDPQAAVLSQLLDELRSQARRIH